MNAVELTDTTTSPEGRLEDPEHPDKFIDTHPAPARFAQGGESYKVLVWRRFRRSISGMIGLILVVLLLVISVFVDFFAPVAGSATHWLSSSLQFVKSPSTMAAAPSKAPLCSSWIIIRSIR